MTAEPCRACPCRAVSSPVDLQVLSEAALDIFMPKEGQSLKHVSLLSRHLNGEGMGFFPKAAKVRPHARKLTHAPEAVGTACPRSWWQQPLWSRRLQPPCPQT